MAIKSADVPAGLLSKEFLQQFKTEEDVSKFLKNLHSQVLEQMLQGEMDAPWDMRSMMLWVIIQAILGMAAIPS